MPLELRPLQMEDLPLLTHWLAAEHVRRWWGDPLPYDDVVAKYGPRIAGDEPTSSFLAVHAATIIGYAQTYLIRDYPDYARQIEVEPGAAGADIFIGDARYLHRGFGPAILRRLLRDVIFTRPDVTCCVIGPAISNTAAIRAYAAVGFRPLKVAEVDDEPEPEYLMRIEPDQVT